MTNVTLQCLDKNDSPRIKLLWVNLSLVLFNSVYLVLRLTILGLMELLALFIRDHKSWVNVSDVLSSSGMFSYCLMKILMLYIYSLSFLPHTIYRKSFDQRLHFVRFTVLLFFLSLLLEWKWLEGVRQMEGDRKTMRERTDIQISEIEKAVQWVAVVWLLLLDRHM